MTTTLNRYSLNVAQQNILNACKHYQDKNMYLTQVRVDFNSSINETIWWQAWELIVKRHTYLSSSLQIADEKYFLQSNQAISLPKDFYDLCINPNTPILHTELI